MTNKCFKNFSLESFTSPMEQKLLNFFLQPLKFKYIYTFNIIKEIDKNQTEFCEKLFL